MRDKTVNIREKSTRIYYLAVFGDPAVIIMDTKTLWSPFSVQ